MSSLSAAEPANTVPRSVPSAGMRTGDGSVHRELRWFRAILGLCFVATIALSWRLWLSSGRDYPLVPVIDGFPQPPFPVDWLLLGAMMAALLGMSFARRPRPYLITVLVITFVWLVLDQTRWQPYMLTFLAATASLLLGESPSVRAPGDPPARWHMAPYLLSLCALYVYSGLHKLNIRFLETSFPSWVNPFTDLLRVDPASIPQVLFWPGVAASVGEAAMGLALLWPRTRRPAVVGLTLMHTYIVMALGRHGMAGNTVVWPWNVAVVATLWLLIWRREPAARLDGFMRAWWRGLRGRGGAAPVPRPLRVAVGVVIVVFGLLPALSFKELWYASFSFQMYAGKQRHIWIYYRPDQRIEVPPAVQAEQPPGRVALMRWAILELNVIPVTETHVVTRIGREVARRAPGAEARVVIAGAPAAVSGARGYRTFVYRGPSQVPQEVATTDRIPRIDPIRRRE